MKNGFAFGLLGLMLLLAGSCSEQKMSETDIFSKANQYMEQQNWLEAETFFLKSYSEYPEGLFSAKALFMVGYLNANHLDDLEKAKQYYTLFIEKYPDHELATAAQYEIEHLGTNPDELPFLNDNIINGAVTP